MKNSVIQHHIKKLNRKTPESILKEKFVASEIRYRRLFESAKDGILILDAASGKIIDANPFLINLLGFSKEKFIEKKIWEIGLFRDIAANKEKFQELQRQEYVRYENLPIVNVEGRKINVEFVSNVYLENNKMVIQCNIRDITERKIKETELVNSELRRHTLLQTIPDLIWLKDIEGKYLSCNIMFERFFGASEADIVGKTDYDFVNTKLADSFRENDQKAMIADKPSINEEWITFADDGSRVYLETIKAPMRDAQNNLVGILGIGRDITNRNKAEEALQESENRYRSFFENSMDAILLTSSDGKTLSVNNAACEMFGYSADELIRLGKAGVEDITDSRLSILLEKRALKGKSKGEVTFIRKNGTHFPAEISSSLFKNNYGLNNASMIIRDITERKMAEKELVHAKEKAEESDRLKSAFLTNVSHEIRTPLNGVLGFAELLKEPNLSSEDQHDFIHTMQISGARLLNTINSIVDISKIESGLTKFDIKETNINEKIEFTYKFFKPEVETKGLEFLFKNGLQSKEAIIRTDNEKVYAILTNLIKNAIKFTYYGSIEFGYEKKGEYLEFFVKDTGIGIPKNQQELIFERFRQGSESDNRNYEGSGLGLSISKSYAEMLGGKMWLKSEEGVGSIFYFTIPYNAVSKEGPEKINVVPDKDIEQKKLKILIVEDDEISYSLLSIMLQKISHEILHAITGVQAIEDCRSNPDLDLILMDIRMPLMDGNEATRQIRQFNKDVIIIAQTAYAFSGDREKAIESGCNEYITKPINFSVLHNLIKKLVRH